MAMKYPIKINLFISEEMDDRLDDVCEVMGVAKHDFIRVTLGNALMGFDTAKKVFREKVNEESPLV